MYSYSSLNRINETNNSKKKLLHYLAFIKFIAMIIIIKWHIISWKERRIDYGARMCEILFIASGFLVGYNNYNRNMICDYESSFKYSYKRLRTFYPLLFLNTIYGYIITERKKYNLKEITLLFSILLLIKSWSRHSQLATFYNGHSWFLSSLLFSYFLVPLLLQGLKNIKISITIFIIISFIRTLLEELIKYNSFNMFDADFHRGPIIRLLEFYMGMLLIPLFNKSKLYLDKYSNTGSFKIIFTFIEIVNVIIIYFIMLKYNNVLDRCYFVMIFCIFIFISGYEYGFISDLLNNKILEIIISCQMEMYILQRTVNITIYKLINMKKFESLFNNEILFLIKLFIIFICGYLYKILLKEKLSLLFDKLFLFKFK